MRSPSHRRCWVAALALVGCRNDDTLVVAKLDYLARSLRAAKDIVAELTAMNVKFDSGSVHDPLDPASGGTSSASSRVLPDLSPKDG